MLWNKSCDWWDSWHHLCPTGCCMFYFSSFALLSPFLLCRQILLPVHPLLPSFTLCFSLLSRPAVMSKGQRVSCLLLCCQCSCLLLRCLLALAFRSCTNKSQALHWKMTWGSSFHFPTSISCAIIWFKCIEK